MTTSIEISEEAGVRYLHFGSRWVQGAMRVARPYALELEYTREMMFPLLLKPGERWPRRVLLIGLGAASLTKFLYRQRPQAMLTVIEIEPDVVNAARQFFRLPVDPKRVTIDIGDGHEYLATTRRTFDLIMVDGYDAKGRAGMLDTLPFYCNARARLAENGLVVCNLLSRTRGKPATFDAVRAAFDGRVLALPPSAAGNTIVVAAKGAVMAVPHPVLGASAMKLRRDTGLNLLPTLARLAAAHAGDGGVVL
jgi:spermidine synthase